MRLREILSLAGVVALGWSPSAIAVQQGVAFGGTIGLNNFCQILLVQDGALAQNSDLTQLASNQPAGRPGLVEITATRASYQVWLDSPTGFTTMPTGGDTGVTFSSSYSLTGATSASNVTGGTATRLKIGQTNLAADLVANRSGDTFPAGNYSSEVTVRCE